MIDTFWTTFYTALNERDSGTVLNLCQPDVEWAYSRTSEHVHGRDAVRALWEIQWQVMDPYVEPTGMRTDPTAVSTDEKGRIVVTVHHVMYDRAGRLVRDEINRHAYTMQNNLVQRRDILGPEKQ